MQRSFSSPIYKSIIKGVVAPLGQIVLFITGSGLVLSIFMILMALIFRGSAVDQAGHLAITAPI